MATAIKASTNNAAKFFNLDGLDYEKGVFTLYYDSIEVNTSGVIDYTKARVGVRSRSEFSMVLIRPKLVTDWTDGTTAYSSFNTLIADASELVADRGGAINFNQKAANFAGFIDGTEVGQLAYATASQGTAWLPGTLGGTYYPAGWYVWDGADWVSDRDAIADQFNDILTNSVGGDAQTATGDGTTTINWELGNFFHFQFGAFNETFIFTPPTKPGTFILKMIQDSVGSRTATWPATLKWIAATAPTLTTTATTGTDIITLYYDGTNYFGVEALNFS
tara:strand:+ start:21605 stop:22435 length:831 start_codon:yes stop_codon:yes gene_type:complete